MLGVHRAGPIGARERENPKVRWNRWDFAYEILLLIPVPWETCLKEFCS